MVFSALLGRAAELTEAVPASALEKEAHGMAMIFERDIAMKDPAFLERCFDLETCVDTALDGLSPPSSLAPNYRQGIMEGFQGGFARGLLKAGSVRFLRMRRVDNEARFVFRVVPKEGGVNYFELVFDRTRRNGVKAVDLYNYSLGQKLTYTFRHAFLPVAHLADQSWSGQLSKKDAQFLERFKDLETMASLNAQARFHETLAIYARLPDALQKEKLFLIPQMQAATHADMRAFHAAVDLWRGAYPGEASVDLVAANLFFAKRSYELAFAALDRFDKSFGGDAYLDVLRGQQYKNQDHLDEARASARKAVTRNPRISEGWELLISVALGTRNYTEVAQVLTEWESKTSIDVFRVAEGDKLYDFRRSAPGRQWFAERNDRHPAPAQQAAPARAAAAPAPAVEAMPKMGHKLQGIFYSAANPSAIISGRTVFTGDRIAGGFRVEKITQQSVTLKSPEGSLTELALK
ncbi:MAG: hypothetical protein QOF48_2705 [Verrucomicrobiota bacterium]|jgi:tetratricopeptide (TPR) repeat protein